MPRYNYECLYCLKRALKKYQGELTGLDLTHLLAPEVFEEEVLFETSHAMNPTDEELHEAKKCPRCKKHNSQQTHYGSQIHSYIRGYGWLDRAGAKRDMNRFKLQNDDPYGQYRVPGEVDHIKNTLDKEGMHDSKSKHFPVSKDQSMESAVGKAISQPKD